MEKQTKHWWVINLTLGNRNCEKDSFKERESQHFFFGTIDDAFEYFITSTQKGNDGLKLLSFRTSEERIKNPKISYFFCKDGYLDIAWEPKCQFNLCCYDEQFSKIKISCLKRNGKFDFKKQANFLKKFDQLMHARHKRQY